LIELFTKNQTTQIILLRFINIGLLGIALMLFRKILLRTKLSNALTNLILLLFVLVPIVPQLAGQINYDNLLIPLVAVICLLTFNMIDEIRAKKPTFKTASLVLILAMFTSIVKYAFLPIFLAVVCFFVFFMLRYYRKQIPKLFHFFITNFKQQSVKLKILLLGLLVISGGMLAQRDVVNLIKYHAIEPDCSKVLSVQACSAYSAWDANYTRHQAVLVTQAPRPSHDVVVYAVQWIYWMWYRTFFAVSGPTGNFENFPPLPLPSAIALVICLVGLVAVAKYRRQLFGANPYATFLLMAIGFYVLALFVQGYFSYRSTDVLEDMNGRYLLPVMLLVVALFGQAFSLALKRSGQLKIAIGLVALLFFLEGGGLVTYITRSDNTWYFSNSKAVQFNNVAKKLTKPLVVKGSKSYSTPIWFFN